mmetsp:Transcript_11841/g.47786  ORF Transcript_11841/g.47786 Transcript_11841/m.47786 type:complete len:257 (-) Transcript_11841:644-1414(-)
MVVRRKLELDEGRAHACEEEHNDVRLREEALEHSQEQGFVDGKVAEVEEAQQVEGQRKRKRSAHPPAQLCQERARRQRWSPAPRQHACKAERCQRRAEVEAVPLHGPEVGLQLLLERGPCTVGAAVETECAVLAPEEVLQEPSPRADVAPRERQLPCSRRLAHAHHCVEGDHRHKADHRHAASESERPAQQCLRPLLLLGRALGTAADPHCNGRGGHCPEEEREHEYDARVLVGKREAADEGESEELHLHKGPAVD